MAIKPCFHPSGANQVPVRISAIEIAAVNQMSAIARLLDFFRLHVVILNINCGYSVPVYNSIFKEQALNLS